nr:hypothetical protein [Tanacetum cinerariifolium]
MMTGALRRGNPGDDIGATPSGISRNVIGATPSGISGDDVEATLIRATPFTKEQEYIEGHLSTLRSLVKEHNRSREDPVDTKDNRIRRSGIQDADQCQAIRQNNRFGRSSQSVLVRSKLRQMARVGMVSYVPANLGQERERMGMLQGSNINNYDSKKGKRNPSRFQGKVDCGNRLYRRSAGGHEDIIGEVFEAFKKLAGPVSTKEDQFHKGGYGVDQRRNDGRNILNNRDGLAPYHPQVPYQAPRGDHEGYHHLRLNLNSLTKQPEEILASESQLNLQPPRPMKLPPKKENQDRYFDYHGEKGHYTNNCFRLRRQLEMALKSGKLNHLIKDVRQRGRGAMPEKIRGRHGGVSNTQSVCRSGSIGRGFAGGVVKPLGKIELEVVFGDGGLFRRARKEQMVKKETHQNMLPNEEGRGRVDPKEGILVNPSYPDQPMAQEDEEKTAFYTYHGTYCYTKMPFGLKSTRATYQRLVDTAFQSQIRRNLKAYVDDMVIKSNDEKVLIADIDETFDNLRKINMKLNQKKCSFSVEEGKSLGYTVTSEGIRANPKKTKAIADMQSPRTLREMKEETLHVYLAAAEEDMSAILLMKRNGKQCLIHYVSRTLNEAEKNYAPLEKLVMSLLHMSRRLRRSDPGRLLIRGSDRDPSQSIFRVPTRVQNKDDVEKWTLFTDGASNSKGFGADLVLISLSGTKFTNALRQNFTSTNNEAEYEALIAGLRMAAKMKVQVIDVKGETHVLWNAHRSKVCGSKIYKAGVLLANYAQGCQKCDLECDSCQVHAPVPRRLKTLMTSIIAPWPFYQWGMDILRPLPQSAGKVKFVIVAIDYFTKWIEAKPLAMITGKEVKKFEEKEWGGSTSYPTYFMAHRTSLKQSNGETPFNLTYGSEAVIPVEIGMPTNRTMMIREDENENELRLNMDLL